MSDLSKTKRIEVVNLDWEWVDESKEVIESITGKPSSLSASTKLVSHIDTSMGNGMA